MDLVNLAAETGRNIIGDDSSATLNLENSSTGECLKLQNAGGTGVQLSAVSCPTTSIYAVSGAVGADITGGGAGSATVPAVKVTNSGASAVAFEFGGGVWVSTASSCITYAGKIRIKHGNTYSWIPTLPALA